MAIRYLHAALVVISGVGPMLCGTQCFGEDAEQWNAHGQMTYMYHAKPSFRALYTNLNGTPDSLVPDRERSWTATATAFLGFKTWTGGELYLVPEMIAELPLSGLRGLGGSVQNGELQKTGDLTPTFYRARAFIRQTWGFGGAQTKLDSAPMQLAKTEDSRRFVLTAGNLAIIDVFDKNIYAGDVRQQFLNMNFLTYSAYDFDADARGYSWGVAGEYYHDDWALRAGRFIGPRHPNQLQLNYSPFKYYGDQVEIEHSHTLGGKQGKLRVLAFRNVGDIGRWDDAINAFLSDPSKNAASCTGFNYGSANPGAPDLCWARRTNTKIGIGVSGEQALSDDIGVFFRGMKTDGKVEVQSFTSTDSSLSFGALLKGVRWSRPDDSLGVAYARNWISALHAKYLDMGGIDGFIGDGKLSYKPEQTLEAFYNLGISRFFSITIDYQYVANPAYNADRGPVKLYGVRLHAEF